jgi:hypothetical protein
MIITAKFASVCPCCNSRIVPGSKVEWTKGSPARHTACAGATGEVRRAVASVRPYRSYRRASGAGAAAPVAGYSSWCTGRQGCGCYDCAS